MLLVLPVIPTMLQLLRRHLLPVLVATPLVVVGIAPVLAGPAAARPEKSIDQRISDVKGLLSEASREEAVALDQYLEVKGRKDAADARVADAASRTAAAVSVLQAAQAKVDAANRNIEQTTQRIAQIEAERREAAATFKAAAVRQYINAWAGSDGITNRVELDDIVARGTSRQYLRSVTAKEDREIQRYLQLGEDAEDERSALEAQKVGLETAKTQAATEAARVRAIQSEEEAARNVVAQEAAAVKRVADQISAKKASYERDLSSLQASSDSIKNQLRSRGGGGGGEGPKGSGQLLRPVGGPMTSAFGPRTHPIFNTVRMHNGVDFGSGMGTPIKSAADGTCVFSGVMSGYGNVVVVDHGGGLATLYAHQSRTACGVGTKVARGQVIGFVGSTGNSTGPHLHFEVRINGNPVNPAPYL